MAAEVANVPINGTYAPHQGYGTIDPQQNYNAYASNAAASQSVSHAAAAVSNAATPSAQQADVPKDEVGWYFVEQYYTTLSRSPEKLYLFYNKRSQFVSGQETDKVAVCVGQRAINDRIKDLDFQDCKVRVTNVDSQASDANIVIQVIGEISNKSQPHKKFTQTFVLATQTNGYFVLNDIFRYLIEEEDEDASALPVDANAQAAPTMESSGHQEPVPAQQSVEPKTLTSSVDPVAIERDAKQVDKGLEEKVLKAGAKGDTQTQASVNGGPADQAAAHTEDASVAAPSAIEVVASKNADLQPEKPRDPEPTPAAVPSPPKQATPQPAAVPKPAVPKTWASLAASANKGATPIMPSASSTATATTTSSAQGKPASVAGKAPTPTSGPQSSAAPAIPAVPREPSPATTSEQDEWTAVGGAHNRQQSRQVTANQSETPLHRGYIKNVHEGIDASLLKAALEKHAEVTYFDIARQKNCAFVDFKTTEGYNAAVSANPHTINGEQLFVEERRVRPGSTPYVPRGQFQGSRGGRGGNTTGAPRGAFQQGGRGGFPPRGRGTSTPRGRGGAPAA